MSGQFLSPIQLLDVELLSLDFKIESFRTIDAGSSVTVTLSHSFDDGFSLNDPKMVACKCNLEVIARFDGTEENGTEGGSCACSCAMGGIVACPLDEEDAEGRFEEINSMLMANVISMLYAEIRANIEWVTSRSPVGRQILPAISPFAYLEEVAAQKQEAPKDGDE